MLLCGDGLKWKMHSNQNVSSEYMNIGFAEIDLYALLAGDSSYT